MISGGDANLREPPNYSRNTLAYSVRLIYWLGQFMQREIKCLTLSVTHANTIQPAANMVLTLLVMKVGTS
jgi:hypothetical protein